MAFPPTFDRAFDETFPPDTQLANLLGQDIRNLKTDIRERLALLSGTFANRPTNMDAAFGGAGYGYLYFATDTQQLFQWNGAAWVQLGFNSNIVASVNLMAQNAAIGFTTLYAVPASGAGMYRASIHEVLTTNGTGGLIIPGLSWTNDGGPETTNVGPGLNASGGVGLESDLIQPVSSSPYSTGVYIYSVASQNIQYRVVFSGVTGAPVYSLRIRLEYLG
jgi:hypothetical protein